VRINLTGGGAAADDADDVAVDNVAAAGDVAGQEPGTYPRPLFVSA